MIAIAEDKGKEDWAALNKLSVKELRRRAALHNCPLTHIGAAVEKDDLIKLIVHAGPVKDTYDISLGVKVHTAASIAQELDNPKPKEKKKEKKKKRRRSSSSSGSSSGSRGGRRKKRSKSRRRSPRKKDAKRKSRSPSLVMVVQPKAQPMRALPATPGAGTIASSARAKGIAKARAKRALLKALPMPPAVETIIDDVVQVQKLPETGRKSVAQAGMAAAVAMGFSTIREASHAPVAPAPGLRPTVNPAGKVPFEGVAMSGGGMRICVSYLCFAKCDLGANCPEAHVIDPEEEMRVRARFKEQECHAGETCTRTSCLFRHPGELLD